MPVSGMVHPVLSFWVYLLCELYTVESVSWNMWLISKLNVCVRIHHLWHVLVECVETLTCHCSLVFNQPCWNFKCMFLDQSVLFVKPIIVFVFDAHLCLLFIWTWQEKLAGAFFFKVSNAMFLIMSINFWPQPGIMSILIGPDQINYFNISSVCGEKMSHDSDVQSLRQNRIEVVHSNHFFMVSLRQCFKKSWPHSVWMPFCHFWTLNDFVSMPHVQCPFCHIIEYSNVPILKPTIC